MLRKEDSIRDRLIDAQVLWDKGQANGAFILALLALAGVASIRYPKKTAPRVYYDKMREYHPAQELRITANEKRQESKRLTDGQRFKCMLLDLIQDIVLPNPKPGVHPPRTNFSLPFSKGKKTNIEDLFYKVLRCPAVHEGTFSSVAYLTQRTPEGDVMHLTEPAGIPEWWTVHLIAALDKTDELA